ncbi:MULTISPECIES: hypothetical protein [Paracoccus]|jgi:hypothetical protein|uniref:IacB protein n=1 Tax=Paracoccus litorisediminis TaxID=2006130 RepID=A0A844HS12_9RHOB|nr:MULTISPECIES: hypothetical protein [Paracoccus]MBD9527716.1 hypothetical protein [Paracoccus sp. PAR01]MTH60352.1 hypothetical protein [Paracoccus litorisediminis]
MTEKAPIRTLLCFAMQPAFFDLPFDKIGPVWKATQTLMAEVAKIPGTTVLGTLDDDQTQVGTSPSFPPTWYIMADFPDREAVIAACNLLRTIQTDDQNHRLWKYMRVEARMGRALEIPQL